jgi:hypothetical protein
MLYYIGFRFLEARIMFSADCWSSLIHKLGYNKRRDS